MADGSPLALAAPAENIDGGAILFVLGGARYALPLEAVEAITMPPALCEVPHAPASLLGAGNLGGHILPVIDLAALLPGTRIRRYDGGGQVLRVSAAGGSVGVWVDRVERFVPSGLPVGEAITVIDPEPLVRAGLAAPNLAAAAHRPLGDADELVARAAPPESETRYFLIEAAGERLQLPYETVAEFVDLPPFVPVPRAPAGFLGVGIVRGDALPMLSLAALLNQPDRGVPESFAVIVLPEGRLLLGFDRVIGLRAERRQTGRRWVDQAAAAIAGAAESGRPFDVAAALSDELREVIAGFVPAGAASLPEAADDDERSAPYLVFGIGGEAHALPVDAVDRVVPAQRLVALPRCAVSAGPIAGAIELRGQLVPVAQLGHGRAAGEPGAYVIFNGASGPMALGADRVERLIRLSPEQIAPAPGDDSRFYGVAVLDGADDVLRVLSPAHLGLEQFGQAD